MDTVSSDLRVTPKRPGHSRHAQHIVSILWTFVGGDHPVTMTKTQITLPQDVANDAASLRPTEKVTRDHGNVMLSAVSHAMGMEVDRALTKE